MKTAYLKNLLVEKVLTILWGVILIPLMALGVWCCWASVYTIISQFVLWLKTSYWVSMPLIYLIIDPRPELSAKIPLHLIAKEVSTFSDPLWIVRQSMQIHSFVSPFSDWLVSPKNWLGLHAVVNFVLRLIPAWLPLFLFGWGFFVPGRNYLDNWKNNYKKSKRR